MAENKTKPTSASVDDFIAAIDNPRRRADALVSLALYKEVTGLQPVMWGPSIIGFGSSHYVYETGREGDMPAAGFSPRKANLTFYVGDDFEGAAALYARLGKHKKSVACLYINKLDDVDRDVLREIIARQYAEDAHKGGVPQHAEDSMRSGPRPAGGTTMPQHRIYRMTFSSIYPMYIQKAERKNRTKEEVDQVICWLTGYGQAELQRQIELESDLETFFARAPLFNPNASLIKGVVCGVRVEDIEDPLMRKVRYLDKLIDELAKGKAMDKILRQ